MLLGGTPEEKNIFTSRHMWGPIVRQWDWKKLAENPSGPGALSWWMEKHVLLISSWEGSSISRLFVSSETQGVRASNTVCVLSPS